MALSESEVKKQIQHMVSFMEQEAAEKANEIMVKAEEEFDIEKGRIVQQEKRKIQLMYEKKEKQIDVQRKIVYSNELNKNRLKVLSEQNENLIAILDDAKANLGSISSDESRYSKLLEKLILEGMFAIYEDSCVIKCRKADQSLVETATKVAAKEYEQTAKKPVATKVVVDLADD